ncbi:SMU1112c/YaeR family gloxylase I-like metalloprotein [Vibrio rumoiensis]|uniref:VOC domain-containing protein n=1 Tax=Vibrio rumoiensis 1S-45 TaxID=1188252 RepID=A0A1E5DZ70_9VIBR|nr:VOC family protein [Vibrio rumoiensis]OEF23207.1 hypothetical protein A1QC_12605 [Vibrio rumoiensis 1S-45]
MFKSIHHIAIICSDYQRSKIFYTQILEFKVINETYRAERDSYKLDLAVSEHSQIELFSFPHPPKRVNQPEACGLRHLAFSVDDVQATVAQLTSKSVECEPIRIDALTGKAFTFFQDPDGLPIEIYQI